MTSDVEPFVPDCVATEQPCATIDPVVEPLRSVGVPALGHVPVRVMFGSLT